MKKGIAIILVVLAGCQTAPTEESKILKRDNRNLIYSNARKTEEVAEFKQYLREIENELDDIKMQELQLSTLVNVEEKSISSDRIKNDLQGISDLLRKNSKRISQLQKVLASKKEDLGEFKVSLDLLQSSLNMKITDLQKLTGKLVDKDLQISTLEDAQFSLLMEMEWLLDDMNRVYYAVGNYKELKEAGVVEKRGGILGLGAVKSLKKDFDSLYFEEADESEMSEVPLFCSKATLLTNHPTASYEFVESDQIETLRIIDPETFWASSKHLCVLIQ